MKIKNLIIKTDNSSFYSSVEYIINQASEKKKTFLVTLNPELVMLAKNDQIYENALSAADKIVADGIGIVLAGKIFGKNFNDRVHGVELIEAVCSQAEKNKLSVGFLGARGHTAMKVAEKMKKINPGLNIAFAYEEENQIKSSDFSDILFVAFGSPKQELWIKNHKENNNFFVGIGVGGSFDFISGNVKRAPKVIRRLGFEWLFRLIIEPWRIRRQLKLPVFLGIVLKEKIFG